MGERDPVLRENGDGDVVLLCPECRGEYSHIRMVCTRVGTDAHEAVVYKGTQADGTVADERRSALAVILDGECGHAWELRIQQHKGVNWLQSVPASVQGSIWAQTNLG
jgi:hypothetical protein